MCMNNPFAKASGGPSVDPEKMDALSGQGLTTADPRFVGNTPTKKNRMSNLRIRRKPRRQSTGSNG